MLKKKLYFLLGNLILISGFSSLNLFAQSGCENADLETGTFLNWSGQTGHYNGTIIMNNNAIVNGRHTIMTGTGTDPNTCNNLTVVAPGSTTSARLGDALTGFDIGLSDGGAEILTYDFFISPQSSMIIYKYAVVFENPAAHSNVQMPRFLASLIDLQTNQIVNCTEYNVFAGAGIPGFSSCGSVVYSDWKTVGVDVSQYMGQTLRLKFTTTDCSISGHYGYAYVDASCAPFALDTRYCVNVAGVPSAVVEAPTGFDSYYWTDSVGNVLGTTPTITIQNPVLGDTVNCQITSFNGCIANLQAVLTPSNISPTFASDTACLGSSTNLINTTIFVNAVQDSIHWSSSDGFSSDSTVFSHIFPAAGTYSVTMFVQSDAGCFDSIVQDVIVAAPPTSIFSPIDICTGQSAQLVSLSTVSIGTLTDKWIINGDTLIGSNISYNFNLSDTINIQLISTSGPSCADTSIEQIIIHQNPTSNFSFVEQCITDSVTFNSTSIYTGTPTYNWVYNSTSVSNDTLFTDIFSNSGNDSITLIIIDTHAEVTCIDTNTQNFFVHDNPNMNYLNTSLPCVGESISITNLSGVSTGETISYIWSINGTPTSTNVDLTHTFSVAGTYTINLLATTDFNCINDTTFTIDVFPIPEPPVLAATTPICPGDNITFTASAEDNSTIQWSGPNNFASQNFTISMPFNISDMGTYSAFITSQHGCISGPSSIPASILHIYNFDDFVFPNVITANNDGINDTLDLESYFKTCEEYTLYIFNRWGNMVYQQTRSSAQFTGKTEENKDLEEGVYFYKLEIHAIDGEKLKSGFIHVVK